MSDHVRAPSGEGVLKSGAATIGLFSAADAGSKLWSVTAGKDGEINGIQVQDPDKDDPIFNAFDVNYDLGGGTISLYPNPNTVSPSGGAVPSGGTVPSESPNQ